MKRGFLQFLYEMRPYISSHSSNQHSSGDLLLTTSLRDYTRILDLGCGKGCGIDLHSLMQKNPGITIFLVGLDISDINQNSLLELVLYDGNRIPFKDASFDIVYCNQVLEHVRYPDAVIAEVARIIKSDGFFIGSVSHTEPYHAYSIFNWTPYGLVQVFSSAGFKSIRVFSGIDSMTLLLRRISLGRFGNYFFSHESLFNIVISGIGKILRFSHPKMNALKLLFCGQFSFCAKKNSLSKERSGEVFIK